jgi:hypothetical protein
MTTLLLVLFFALPALFVLLFATGAIVGFVQEIGRKRTDGRRPFDFLRR